MSLAKAKKETLLAITMAYQTFQQEYMQMPSVTRAYTTACVVTTLAVVRHLFCCVEPCINRSLNICAIYIGFFKTSSIVILICLLVFLAIGNDNTISALL